MRLSFNLGGEKLNTSQPALGAKFAIVLIVLVFFAGLPLAAQEGQESPEPVRVPLIDESTIILGEDLPNIPSPSTGSSFGVMIKMVLVLALCAIAIYGVVYFIKRATRPSEARDPNLKVLARTPLSTDSFAAVISVGTKAWLVGGGGGGGVNLISEITEPEPLETMLLEDARRTAEADTKRFMDFRSIFSGISGASRDKKTYDPHAGINFNAESLRKQRERLRNNK